MIDTKLIAPMATPYNQYRYLYSPRPEQKTPPESLDKYDDGTFIAQPKLNGANTLIFMDGTTNKVMNRHNQDKTGDIASRINFAALHRGTGYMVLNGEWMEKSKKDESGANFNGNFIIFDILVFNGQVLTGSTTLDRIFLLRDLYGDTLMKSTPDGIVSKEYLYTTPLDNIWRVCSYENNFRTLYHDLATIDMYEGLVLKKKFSKLLPPYSEAANKGWQLKSRKPTKIYGH
jgi:ATP-dependent DNA ligase